MEWTQPNGRPQILATIVHLVEPQQASPVSEKIVSKPKSRRKAVAEFIRSARNSLLLSVFRCNDLVVLHELAEAAARGVKVEVLVTRRAKGWGKRLGSLAGCLERMGVAVHRFPGHGMKYHAKFMVADEEVALVGTLNLTRKCLHRTRDFALISQDPKVVSSLVRMFRADTKGVAAPETTERLIVGPDKSRERVESILRSAQRSIRILDHKLSDPGILAILRDRRRHGVEVEINNGRIDDSLVPHGRLIVVDHTIALFGSLALSKRSLDSRRELAVVIEQPELLAKLVRVFEKMPRPATIEVAA